MKSNKQTEHLTKCNVFTRDDDGIAKKQTIISDFLVTFEPKQTNRFITYIKNQNNEDIIPSYLIKAITRPSFSFNPITLSKQYSPITITCYDPILPQLHQIIYSNIEQLQSCNISYKGLCPVASAIEHYEISNASLINVQLSDLNWSNTEASTVNLTFNVANPTSSVKLII